MRISSTKSADAAKSVHHSVPHEVGRRWYEVVSVSKSAETGFDVYILRQMHTTRTRYYHDDKTKSLSDSVDSEVEGVRRTVQLTAQSTTDTLRDGSKLIKNALIYHLDRPTTFLGQMVIHNNGRVSIDGYH